MKKSVFFLLFLYATTVVAQEFIIEHPSFSVLKSKYHEITRVTVNDTATILDMVGINNPRWWISVSDTVKLKIGNKSYPVRYAENIEFKKETYTNDKGEYPFRLIFPPIPKETKKIDYIDGISAIYGIELKSPVLTDRVELPESVKAILKLKDDGLPLAAPKYEYGKSTLKGQFLAYRSQMNYKVNIYVDDPITGVQNSYEAALSEDGRFECQISLPTTLSVLFRVSFDGNYMFYNDYILLSPDKESDIYIDLQQKSCQESRFRGDKCNEAQYMFFTGANAEINNQMNRPEIIKFCESYSDHDQLMKDIAGMNIEQYKDYRMQKTAGAISQIPEFKLTRKAADYLKLKIEYNNIYHLMFADSDLSYAYRKANNIKNDEDMKGYKRPIPGEDYYSFLKDSPINDPVSLYNSYFGNMVNSCKYVYSKNEIEMVNSVSENILDELKQTEDLDEEEKEIIEFMRGELMENWKEDRVTSMKEYTKSLMQKYIETGKLDEENTEKVKRLISLCDDKNSSIIEVFKTQISLIMGLFNDGVFSGDELNSIADLEKYPRPDSVLSAKAQSLSEKYEEKITILKNREKNTKRNKYLANMIGSDKGILFDLMETQNYGRKFEEFSTLKKEELERLSELSDPFYYQYLNQKNNELIAQIEKNKSKKGYYNVYEVPEMEEDKILHEILKPFQGKVVLIDFWETWCGPCRSAMKQFESAKKDFKDKDVVFVYLASESSPKNTWDNMIPTIEGEHFRVKSSQMDYLRKKYGIRGVPSYMILDKQGEQTYFKVGFAGTSEMSKELNKALAR